MLSGISLWGLFEYTNETLFDSIQLTERLDKNNLVSHIIDKHGQLDLWQQNPIIVKRKINTFFLINYDNFDKMAEVLQMDYNPLENYDRSESTTENRDTNRSGANQSNTQTSNASAASGESHSTGSNASTIGNYNTEHQVSADNESSYQPLNKDIVSSWFGDTNNNSMLLLSFVIVPMTNRPVESNVIIISFKVLFLYK